MSKKKYKYKKKPHNEKFENCKKIGKSTEKIKRQNV